MKLRTTAVAAGLAGCLLACPALAAPALAVTQSDVDAASAKLSELGDQLSSIQSDLDSATQDVEETSYRIGEKSSEVADAQADLAQKRSDLSGLMRSNYKQGAGTMLDYILGSTSLDDFVSRVIYLDKVSKQRAEKIASVKSAEELLEQEQSELEAKQAEQDEKVASLQSQVAGYDARVSEAADYFNSLDAELQAQLAAAAQQERETAAALAVQAAQEANAQESKQAASEAASSGQSSTDKATDQPAEQQGTDSSKVDDDSGSGSGSGSGSSSGGTSNIPTGGGVASALAAAEAGAPYVYGATGPDSFDCSGLVCYCYGYARGRTTYDMISSLKSTGSWKSSMGELEYGDLCFTSEGHVGIYLGDGQMVHAPSPGRSVCVTTVWSCIGGGTY